MGDKFYLRLPRETIELSHATYLELVGKAHESIKVEKVGLAGGRAYIIEIEPGWGLG